MTTEASQPTDEKLTFEVDVTTNDTRAIRETMVALHIARALHHQFGDGRVTLRRNGRKFVYDHLGDDMGHHEGHDVAGRWEPE